MESIDRLFFNCDYAKWVPREAMEVTRSLVRTDVVNSFEDAVREMNNVKLGSPS